MLVNILLVAIGGALGAVCRYLISFWTALRFGAAFPYGTFLANVLGCFIIGFFMILAMEKLGLDPRWRLFIVTGFLGGLTTFSSYAYESVMLFSQRTELLSFLNVLGNLIVGFSACFLGMVLAKII